MVSTLGLQVFTGGPMKIDLDSAIRMKSGQSFNNRMRRKLNYSTDSLARKSILLRQKPHPILKTN